jgi:methylated-DNA-protein-cysteine methyltransferase-like protein
MGRSIKRRSDLFLARDSTPARRRVSADDHPAIRAIWDVVCAIPRGHASTYGAVARAAGLPGRARFAGFALKSSPDNAHLPWHRVVGAGGHIVFPTASQPYREQARRLRAEGVRVTNGRVEPSCIVDLEQT